MHACNYDGTVDIYDVVTVAMARGSKPRDENSNPAADLDNDALVNIYDVVTVATNFGAQEGRIVDRVRQRPRQRMGVLPKFVHKF